MEATVTISSGNTRFEKSLQVMVIQAKQGGWKATSGGVWFQGGYTIEMVADKDIVCPDGSLIKKGTKFIVVVGDENVVATTTTRPDGRMEIFFSDRRSALIVNYPIPVEPLPLSPGMFGMTPNFSYIFTTINLQTSPIGGDGGTPTPTPGQGVD